MKNDDFKYIISPHSMSEKQLGHSKWIRDTANGFAAMIDHICPFSRESRLALTKLEECVMWCDMALAKYPEEKEEPNEQEEQFEEDYQGEACNDL